tara:strand:- start:1621 stop:2679 length:1059 start_codon:yes stop_codon:yes gene_type:complete
MSDNEYYNVLDVNRDAKIDVIKKAYKKKAMKLHPDRNKDNPNAEEEFKKLGEAYSVLSDDNKRSMYDKFGKKGLDGAGDMGVNPFEMFEEIFNGGDMFEKMAGGGGGHPLFGGGGGPQMFSGLFGPGIEIRMGGPGMRQRVPPVSINIEMTLEEIYTGLDKKLNWTINNNGKTDQRSKVVKIPSGVEDNEKIVLENEGNVNGNNIGPVIIIIHELKHDIFKRSGDDLIVEKDILLSESLCGFEMPIKCLNKEYIIIKTDDIIYPNSIQKCIGYGLKTKYGKKGDLYLKLNIDFPKKLDSKRKEYLKKILPTNKKNREYPKEIKRVQLEEGSDSEEDDYSDEEPRGRPECATQ